MLDGDLYKINNIEDNEKSGLCTKRDKKVLLRD